MKYSGLTGQTFGQLKVISEFIKNYQVKYNCVCSCGKK